MSNTSIVDVGARKVVVLGGRGFLGTHLVNALAQSGAAITVFDRPVARHDAAERDDTFSLQDIHPLSNVEIVSGDFSTGEGLARALRGAELVYHLISTTVPSTSNADPIGDVEGNLIGTLRLLELMKAAEVHRIVYVSSGGTVYGNPTVLPVPETHPLAPLCSYGVVKIAVEHYLQMHASLFGLVANILRVSNPFGTFQHHIGVQGVIPTFFRRMLDENPIEIWGDGSVVRDYIHVSDVVAALLRAGARQESGTFNIGSGVGHSLNAILDVVQRLVGRTPDVRYLPHRSFDVQKIYLDISKARRELSWQPSLSLEAGCTLYWDEVKRSAASSKKATTGSRR
ncbi:NAD-dependent epimerase/dehydratase family protein [Trinickia sp. EG282A]|uniref:NAD-dependent epimerase/dehydratase family protein n=1 Tax=Trinickia sp. EG282A TaxID=3237013 RepID=UPI0034D32CC7